MIKVQELLILNLKKARYRANISQMKLAERANLSSGFIGDIEAGKKFPSARTMQNIIDALELEPFELFLDPDRGAVPYSQEIISRARRDLLKELVGIVNRSLDPHLSPPR